MFRWMHYPDEVYLGDAMPVAPMYRVFAMLKWVIRLCVMVYAWTCSTYSIEGWTTQAKYKIRSWSQCTNSEWLVFFTSGVCVNTTICISNTCDPTVLSQVFRLCQIKFQVKLLKRTSIAINCFCLQYDAAIPSHQPYRHTQHVDRVALPNRKIGLQNARGLHALRVCNAQVFMLGFRVGLCSQCSGLYGI